MASKRICIVGGGIIGLPTAVRLLEETTANISVTLVSEQFSPNTTGDGSAGWIRPFLPGDTEPELVNRWCRETFDFLNQLSRSPEGGILGIYPVSGYDIRMKQVEDPYWKDQVLGYRRMTKGELDQFNGDYVCGLAYTTLTTECKKYLPWMLKRFNSLGGVCLQRKVVSLSELYGEFDIVVNCTGIGAKELLGDSQMQPLKGQLIRVEAPWVKHFVNSEDDDLYILLGSDYVVMGGTHEEGVWSKSIDQSHRQRIWDGCCRLMPSLQRAKVLEEWAGFRPGRKTIRLETEMYRTDAGKVLPVVHNYGHGGSGVTLHWGCAGDAVKLVHSLLEQVRAQL